MGCLFLLPIPRFLLLAGYGPHSSSTYTPLVFSRGVWAVSFFFLYPAFFFSRGMGRSSLLPIPRLFFSRGTHSIFSFPIPKEDRKIPSQALQRKTPSASHAEGVFEIHPANQPARSLNANCFLFTSCPFRRLRQQALQECPP